MPVTMDTYGPFDAGPGANAMEPLWRKATRHNRPDGVLATHVLPDPDNEMEIYATGDTRSVTARVGEVFIHGHWGKIASEKTVPIPPAHDTLPRVDLVVCRADFTGDRIELDVTSGVAGTDPVAPTVTVNSVQADIPLAEVRVEPAASVITNNQITDRRPRQGWGQYQAWTPPLWFEGPANTWQKNPVNMGTGARRECQWFQSGKVVQLHYEFTWGTKPYGGGTGRIWTELPPGMTAADGAGQSGTDHRIGAHLWTTSISSMDFQGTALVSPGTNRVCPFFTYNAVDARIGWYAILGNGPYKQWPYIANGYPEGGKLTINGVLEIR